MNNCRPIENIFDIDIIHSKFWYIFLVIIFTLVIRAILSFFKALAINNGEIDDPENKEEKELKGKGLYEAFKQSFLSNANDIRIDNYWLPAIMGFAELSIFPFFMANSWFTAIAAWIAIKTASSWRGWQKTRTAYNRFLLGNILSLTASYCIYLICIKNH